MGETGLPNKQTSDVNSGSPRPTTQPAPQDERLADESLEDVDIKKVRENETKMNKLGANVEGEGQITPG